MIQRKLPFQYRKHWQELAGVTVNFHCQLGGIYIITETNWYVYEGVPTLYVGGIIL